MPIFRSDAPPSRLQQICAATAALLTFPAACFAGVTLAHSCAQIANPSDGQVRFLTAFLAAIAVAILGFFLCAYWRTRLPGAALILAAGLLAIVFQIRMGWLTSQHRVAWRDPDAAAALASGAQLSARQFSMVIYFRKSATAAQIDDFTSTVLKTPGQLLHPEPDVPWFVSALVPIAPAQAGGAAAVALDLRSSAPASVTDPYIERIRADGRVESVVLNAAPASPKAQGR